APAKRIAVRLLPPVAGQSLLAGTQGLTVPSEDPCSVAVNVYARSRTRSGLSARVRARFAGEDFEVVLTLAEAGGATFDNLQVLGRLVAPAHSIGNAFADTKTISASARRKYVKAPDPFDQVRFLADYERKTPDAFA